jgi:hypothetical protein
VLEHRRYALEFEGLAADVSCRLMVWQAAPADDTATVRQAAEAAAKLTEQTQPPVHMQVHNQVCPSSWCTRRMSGQVYGALRVDPCLNDGPGQGSSSAPLPLCRFVCDPISLFLSLLSGSPLT